MLKRPISAQFRAADLAATETHWKCKACPCGTCLTAGTKPRKCVAGMPIMASWQPATPAEYAAAQPA